MDTNNLDNGLEDKYEKLEKNQDSITDLAVTHSVSGIAAILMFNLRQSLESLQKTEVDPNMQSVLNASLMGFEQDLYLRDQLKSVVTKMLFRHAVAEGNVPIIKTLLPFIASKKSKKTQYREAFEMACQLGRIPVIELLFDDRRVLSCLSADIVQAQFGIAVVCNNVALVRAFLKHPNISSTTFIHVPNTNIDSSFRYAKNRTPALVLSCREGFGEMTKIFLDKMNLSNDGGFLPTRSHLPSALIEASSHNRLDCCKQLLTHSQIRWRDCQKMDALIAACKNGNLEIVKLLLAHCLFKQKTAVISEACQHNQIEVVRWLLRNYYFKTSDLKLALRKANQHSEVIALLISEAQVHQNCPSSLLSEYATLVHPQTRKQWLEPFLTLQMKGRDMDKLLCQYLPQDIADLVYDYMFPVPTNPVLNSKNTPLEKGLSNSENNNCSRSRSCKHCLVSDSDSDTHSISDSDSDTRSISDSDSDSDSRGGT